MRKQYRLSAQGLSQSCKDSRIEVHNPEKPLNEGKLKGNFLLAPEKVTLKESTGTGAETVEQLIARLCGYKPRSSLVAMDRLRCVVRYKSSVFAGENQSREGLGVMLYLNGRVYEGGWKNNEKDGRGYELFRDGSVYQGEYRLGKPEGFGRFQWPSGEIYEGEWIKGLKSGSGIWRGAKGDSYIGEWREGLAEGYGVHTWINGDRYEGQFRNCLKHGEGVEKFNNGDSYKGMYFQGKPEGEGEYYWATGSYFKGQFKNGLRNGYGIWKSHAGHSDKYEGEYADDKKKGYGIFTWASGDVYKGNYIDDLREGYGEMAWSNGNCWSGEWKQDTQIQNNQGNQDTDQIKIIVTKKQQSEESHHVPHNVPYTRRFVPSADSEPEMPVYRKICTRIIPKTSCSQRKSSMSYQNNMYSQFDGVAFLPRKRNPERKEMMFSKGSEQQMCHVHARKSQFRQAERRSVSTSYLLEGNIQKQAYSSRKNISCRDNRPNLGCFEIGQQFRDSGVYPRRFIKTSGAARDSCRSTGRKDGSGWVRKTHIY